MSEAYLPASPCPEHRCLAEPSQEEFERLHPFRSRGLAHANRIVGGVEAEIEALLATRERPRVLDLGCGYGTALVELRKRFGGSVDLHGLNRRTWHGSWSTARLSVAKLGLMDEAEFDRLAPVSFHYADIDDGLPFPDDTFDLVFSQISFVYYRRKAKAIEEINRVLAPGGLAKIDVHVDRQDMPVEYASSFEIWDAGRKVHFWEYAERFESLVERSTPRMSYLEIKKTPSLRLGLEFVAAIDLRRIHSGWWGTKSVYGVASAAS